MTENDIESRAEQAIREAEGEWDVARKLFLEDIEKDEALSEALMQRIVNHELGQAATRLGESTKKCLYCSEIIALDAAKCRFCGEWQAEPSLDPVPRPPAQPPAGPSIIRHFTLLTGWALIVLIIILIIAFAT